MTKPPANRKALARAAAAAFGGNPVVARFCDDSHKASVDIVSCSDAPWGGVTSYATIGVSETPLLKDGKELDVRTELVGACGSQFTEFPKYLSTAAFCVLNSGWLAAPGIIFPDVISMYDSSWTMEHLLFLPPFLWDERLQTYEMDGVKVAWLLAVPISRAELEFAESTGVPALEALISAHQIDIFDLNRAPVV